MKKLLMLLAGLCSPLWLGSCSTTNPAPKGAGSLREILEIASTGNGSLRSEYTDWSNISRSEVSEMKKEMSKFRGPSSPDTETSIMSIAEHEKWQSTTWAQWSWNVRPEKVIVIKDNITQSGWLTHQFGVFEKNGKWFFSKGFIKTSEQPIEGDGKSAPQP
jgi:hypothetical protein